MYKRQLLENGKIETTLARAKEVRSMAEKMITLGKRDDLHAKRQVDVYKRQVPCLSSGWASRST